MIRRPMTKTDPKEETARLLIDYALDDLVAEKRLLRFLTTVKNVRRQLGPKALRQLLREGQ